jgi:regulation of enolase protein 1 (concanavalin A-like superfamily)
MPPRLRLSLTLLISIATLHAAWSAAADKKSAKSVDGWGDVIDPGKDCTVSDKDGKLLIKVPGTNHNLNPTYRYGTNAPRVMQPVTGDFTVQVKVTFSAPPGTVSTVNGRPFNGAGLLVWKDDQNFLRLERNCYWDLTGRLVCYPPLMEDWVDGKYIPSNTPTDASFFKSPSTWFRIVRQGRNLALSMSQDGAEWTNLKTAMMDLGDEVSVGVAAVNSSTKPFTAEFEDLELKTK